MSAVEAQVDEEATRMLPGMCFTLDQSFRKGKRLLARYPPGHVAGIETFFKFHRQRIDKQLEPKLIVSSLMNPPAEVWILRYDEWQDQPGWKQMPDGLKGYLARMLCVQFADTLKHSNLKER
ncbi:YGR125W [Symbiodinium sp. KB8]|nr:YGR125W [Symbiodinium sp. KB8]